jgi:hypothetical protein
MTHVIRIRNGDCKEVLAELAPGSVQSIISDPPYGLTFMGKGWDDLGKGPQQRKWHQEWLEPAFAALQPGGVIKAFCGTRTYHHLAAAMREVGFIDLKLEAWVYGSGFPKSLNISKAIDKAANAKREVIEQRTMIQGGGNSLQMRVGERREVNADITAPATDLAKLWEGWGTALKPAWEPIVVGRKPQ